MSYAEISRELKIPYSIVLYYSLEVRERMREYRRKYRQRCDPEFQEFLTIFEKSNSSALKEFLSNNIYIAILRCLSNKKWGVKYKRLEMEVGKNIRGPLKKLVNKGIVKYEDKRYFLREELKEKVHYLFDENF